MCMLSHAQQGSHSLAYKKIQGPKFTDDLRTILRQLANSQNIYGNLEIYLKTKSYDPLLDVLRQPGPI